MPDISPARALRDLNQAQAQMRKARAALRSVRHGGDNTLRIVHAGWECLRAAHATMAAIPSDAADDAVMTRQAAVQRYATALLVRLRRLARGESVPSDDIDDDADPID